MATGFVKKLIEAITVKLAVETVFAVIIAISGYLGVLSFTKMQLPVWVAILFVLLSLAIVGIVHFRRGKGGFFVARSRKPGHIRAKFEFDTFGVKWTALYGGTTPLSEPYVYIEGPYCPKCGYEMGAEERGILFKKYYWRCAPCGKYFKCPEKYPSDAERVVKKLIEAEIRTGRSKNRL
jgi:ribosomal protein L37AE/L43A